MRWSDRIGRRIKLSDLHILLAVAQSGSMAKAANQLAVSHPVVSRSIRDLEQALGVQLLDRNRHGTELTEYGRALLSRGNAAFDELRQGVKEIEVLADPSAGEVRIGTTAPLAASFVSTVVDRLIRRHPRMVFRVVIGAGSDLQRSLHDRSTDLVIYRPPRSGADDQLSFEVLFRSAYVVAAGIASPWIKRRHIELRELAGEIWALPPPDADNAFSAFVAEAFRTSGLPLPRATVTANALEMRANLLRTGRYLSILPEFWLKLPIPHPFIRKLPVELPVDPEPIGFAMLKKRAANPVVERFVNCAREVAKPFDLD
jgi:molybdate transport repressor ModE-like protein